MAVDNVSSDTPLSVEDLLARSKAAADAKAAGRKTGGSKVQQLLAANGDGSGDIVDLSPVARALKTNAASQPSKTPYTEQDWYLKAKVSQLKAQISIYTNLPGLDPSGAIMDSLTKEVNDLVRKQQAKLKASQDEAAAKQAELEAKQKESDLAAQIPTADQMLKRAKDRSSGKTVDDFVPATKEQTAKDAAVAALLKKAAEAAARGGSVNTSA